MNFYKSAALALDHLDKYQGSVKGSLAAAGVNGTAGETKRTLALVIETLKYRPVLLTLLTTVPLLSLEKLTFPKRNPPKTPSSQSLLLVLLHDLLFSSRTRIEASDKWPPKPAVLRHQARLKAELVKLQIKAGKTRKEDLSLQPEGEESGRYVRYNPNIGKDFTLENLHLHLKGKGFDKLEKEEWPIRPKTYFMDSHLRDVLLVFNQKENWWVGDKWYEQGGIILQDKASCFPAKVLMEGWTEDEGDCLDATAAPGNKTSYISALMGNQRKLYAFEKSTFRFKTLEKMLSKANCTNVTAQRADFTEADPLYKDYKNVTRILLDPSCSGSGIVNRLDYLVEDETEETDSKSDRLDKLSQFQLQMILHAFKFPSVKKVVYSTCSIHPEEDEQVVYKALKSKIGLEKGWRLEGRENVLASWERRGRKDEFDGDEEMADSVIRCQPGVDRTNGFFVACFVRSPLPPKKHDIPAAVESHKRPREEESEIEIDVTEVEVGAEKGGAREKTLAQAERARRKKQSQKKRRKEDGQ
ncbi:25S rRNA (cytosine2278-C5)-methyltransferase, partial [Tremellales sp. Uapishka_1]